MSALFGLEGRQLTLPHPRLLVWGRGCGVPRLNAVAMRLEEAMHSRWATSEREHWPSLLTRHGSFDGGWRARSEAEAGYWGVPGCRFSSQMRGLRGLAAG
jgi:hypothetical protein